MRSRTLDLSEVVSIEPCPENQQLFLDPFENGIQDCHLQCQTLRSRRLEGHAGNGPGSFTLLELKASADAGCKGCQFLRSLLTAAFQGHPELSAVGDSASLRWPGSIALLEASLTDGRSIRLQFCSLKDAKTVVAGMAPSRVLAGDTRSVLSIDRAKRLIKICEHEHAECGTGRDVPLPTRLLTIEPEAGVGSDAVYRVRLETTAGRTGTYACLSHCWGDPTDIRSKTMRANLAAYHESVPWSDIPTSFRDAIWLCGQLGLRYLWIDSLCIIQDSSEDWEVESVRMGDIYQDSYVTIAATVSSGSSGGCFRRTIPDICVSITEPGWRDSALVVVRDCQGTGLLRNSEAVFATHHPLYGRAWVYQERMLSRRVLFCNAAELQIGCRKGMRCECGSAKVAPHYIHPPRTLNVMRLREDLERARDMHGDRSDGDESQLRAATYRSWLTIVEGYTQLRLTQGRDMLPAISAAARMVARGMRSEYLAGIWRASLMDGLLWYARGLPTRPRPRGEHWRAPSWSWASIDAPLGIVHLTHRKGFSSAASDTHRVDIEAAECTPEGKDDMGRVTNGFIRLRTQLAQVCWRIRCKDCNVQPGGKRSPRGRRGKGGLPDADYTLLTTKDATAPASPRCVFPQQTPALDIEEGELSFFADASVAGDKGFYGFEQSPQGGGCQVAPCYLLSVSRPRSSGQGNRLLKKGKMDPDAFIALARVPSAPGNNTYERVGLVCLTHGTAEQRDAWFQRVWSVITGPEVSITLI